MIGELIGGVASLLGGREQRQADRHSARDAMEFERQQAENATNKELNMARDQMNFQKASNQTAMDFEQASAVQQMRFQREMSDTAHQREMADLKKAGLNPMLAVAHGGASSPSGASASGSSSAGASGSAKVASGRTYKAENIAEKVISSALDMRRLRKDISEADSRIAFNKESTKTQGSLRELQDAQRKSLGVGARKTAAETVEKENVARVEKKYPRAFGWYDAVAKRLKNTPLISYLFKGSKSE